MDTYSMMKFIWKKRLDFGPLALRLTVKPFDTGRRLGK